MTVHHIGYLVTDLAKSAKRFEVLGYVPSSGPVYDSYRVVDILFLTKDGITVELVCPKSRDSVVGKLIQTYKNAPYHMCYETVAFDEDAAYLRQNGYTPIDEPLAAPALENRRVCFFMSSRAGIIELLEKGDK